MTNNDVQEVDADIRGDELRRDAVVYLDPDVREHVPHYFRHLLQRILKSDSKRKHATG